MKMTPDEKRAKLAFSQSKIIKRAEKKHAFYKGLCEKSLYNLRKRQIPLQEDQREQLQSLMVEESKQEDTHSQSI